MHNEFLQQSSKCSGWEAISSIVCDINAALPTPPPLPVSPLVEVVVVLRPLDVDELLVLLLVGFTARDGEVLHVPQGLP